MFGELARRIPSAATRSRLVSVGGRGAPIVRRPSPMLLLNVSTKWFQPLQCVGRGGGQPRLDFAPRGARPAGSRQPAALLLSCGLQEPRQFGQLRGALWHFDSQQVSFRLDKVLLCITLVAVVPIQRSERFLDGVECVPYVLRKSLRSVNKQPR